MVEYFYNYYKLATVQQVFTDAKALGHSTYVLAGLSGGAAISQFGALDLTGVKGVYLFGKLRSGNVSCSANLRFG